MGAVLLGGAACAEQADRAEAGGPGGSGDGSARSAPSSQELSRSAPPDQKPPDAQPLPTDRIDGSALPDGHPVEVGVADGGRTLRVVGMEGGCGKASAELTDAGQKRVTVTLVETKPADPDTMCTMDMRYPPLTVELDTPLDERAVVLEHRSEQE